MAVTLAYDDLPPGSDIRRVTEAGSVQISVPAGEPPPFVVRQAAMQGLSRGAILSTPLLAVACLGFYVGIERNRLSGAALTWAWAFFAVFCAAIVALIGWVSYGMIIDTIRAGRRQATVIVATPSRLLIETSGPFGVTSYDYPRERIAKLKVGVGVIEDEGRQLRAVHRLELALADGKMILLLPGRDPRELRWVRGTVAQMLGI